MSKLSLVNRVPTEYSQARMTEILRDIQFQVNNLSEGNLSAKYSAKAAAPVIGTYSVGDFVANNTIAEAGTTGGKYIITGWYCTVSGTPGTWKEARVLTGS
jgi:hypothetical protein